MSDLKRFKLGDIIEDVAMGPFGSNLKVDNFISIGVPVIRGGNLNQNGFDDKNFVFVSEEKAQSLKRSLAYPDDLVFTHRGTIGQVGIIEKTKYPYYLVSQSQMRLTVNRQFLNPRFLYYWFKSTTGQYELLKNSAQVGVPAIASPTKSLKEIDISIPDLPTQIAIAEILSSLDDKIELNNKINQELENLAQTLFKQWFIDFEFPNENGEPYKSSGGEMEASELGEIPKGWEVSNLNQIARLVKNNIKPFENPDTLYFHYSLPEFDSGKNPSIDLGSTILSSKYEVTEHSILVSKLNPRIPRIWTIINPESNSICSTEFQVLKPTKKVFFPFVNYLCKSEIYLSSLQSKVTGTSSSHQRVNPLDIINYEVVLPQIELFDRFFHSTYGFIQKIEKNALENIQLTTLRDTLLPKLISGELEVSQIQTAS